MKSLYFVLSIFLIGLCGTIESQQVEYTARFVYRLVPAKGLDRANHGRDSSRLNWMGRYVLCNAANRNAVTQFVRCNLNHYPNLLSSSTGETLIYSLFSDDTENPNSTLLGFRCHALFGSRSFLLVITGETKVIAYIPEKWK